MACIVGVYSGAFPTGQNLKIAHSKNEQLSCPFFGHRSAVDASPLPSLADSAVTSYVREMGRVQTSHLIPATKEELFAYLTDLQNLPEMLGGRIEVEFPSTPPTLKPQVEFEVQMTRFGIAVRAFVRVEQLIPGVRFGYRQLSGFFRSWSHVMLLDEHDAEQTRLTDVVDFAMPLGLVGALLDDLYVRGDVERLLKFRALKVAEYFERLRRESPIGSAEPVVEKTL